MKQKHLYWTLGALAAAGATGVLLDALVLEKYFFKVKTYNIGAKKGKHSFRLALLADLHFKHTLLPHYERLANKLNQIQPDLLLIAGDTIDSTGEMEPVRKFFGLLDQDMKKVAILGNNDYKAGPGVDSLSRVLGQYNCELLRNKSKSYLLRGEKVVVTGLDDVLESESEFREAVKDVGREKYHLLLIHSPLQQEFIKKEIKKINKERDVADQLNIGYIFAGHTHGGQVRLPGYVPVLPPRSGDYVNGWYNESRPYLYVTKGFGTSTIPLRFMARSEVTIFNYRV